MTSLNAYKLRRQVEEVILAHGGIIFGGHVRDVVLYDIHAELVVSNDIDCYMIAHSVEPFLESLADHHISVQKVFERDDAKKYLPNLNVPHGVLSHVRFKVSNITMKTVRYVRQLVREGMNESALALVSHQIDVFVSSLQQVSSEVEPIIIDMFVADCHNFYTMCPPFGPVDFECNGLIMVRGGIILSPSLYADLPMLARHNMMIKIMGDIGARRAVYVDDGIPVERILKMREKGWKVEMKCVQVCDAAERAADVCLFCHEDIAGKHYKLPCCNAIYHKDCLVKVLSSEFGVACIQCKRATIAHLDIVVLKSE